MPLEASVNEETVLEGKKGEEEEEEEVEEDEDEEEDEEEEEEEEEEEKEVEEEEEGGRFLNFSPNSVLSTRRINEAMIVLLYTGIL
jgi:hypothetical protein